MVRSRFKLRPKRRIAFKDRKLILAEFDELIRLSTSTGGIFRVCSLIGIGGAGKTRLLDRICTAVKDHNALPVRITLESEASGTAAAPLKAIRDQAPFECLLFDTALARYFSASGQIHALASKSGLSSNIALKAVEAGSGAPGLIALPLGFAVEVFDKLKKQTVKYFKYARQEFEEIDRIQTDSAELLERLPFYLGLDFERRMVGAPTRFVFVYDSYEKQRERTVADHAPWLREFIGTLDDGLHVIASREPLAWPDQDWDAICTPGYLVGQLPIEDTRNLFIEECDPPDAMIDALTDLSNRVPFYIEVLISEYLRLADTETEVQLSDLPKSSDHAVARFIGHLEEPFQRLVIALATVQFFDRALAYSLVRGLNLAIDFVEVEDVFTYFFVEPVNAQANLFKTHDLLTSFVRGDVSTLEMRRLSLEKVTEDLLIRDAEAQMGDVMLDLFAGTCAGNMAADGDRSPLLGHMLEIGYRLYDAGYWRELVQIGAEAGPEETLTDGKLIEAFFAAISMRRTVSVDASWAALRRLDIYRERLGEHVVALDIEAAYIAELAGDYRCAREEIARIHSVCTPFDPNRRHHYRSLLYHADFLLMDGVLPRRQTNWARCMKPAIS